MYLTEKNSVIKNETCVAVDLTLYSKDEIKEGDEYEFDRYHRNTYIVDKVADHRFPAKGNHETPVHWYSIKLRIK